MNLLKKYLNLLHGQNKTRIDELYLDTLKDMREEKILEYYFNYLKFKFNGLDFRNPEKVIINIYIPSNIIIDNVTSENCVAIEHYLLKHLYSKINSINDEYFNKNKSSREKPYVESIVPNELVIKRNGLIFDKESNSFIYRLLFIFPLINKTFINGKSSFKAIKEIITLLYELLENINKEELTNGIDLYIKQNEIRKYIKSNNYVSFIANGSILPRKEEINKLENIIYFVSPKSKEINIRFSDNTIITGMGIKKGITVITGGGYSGKTTLLEAIESGVYNHEYSDGRKYCITDDSALRICAVDGRYISNMDISPFFKYIPLSNDITNFSTLDASGSISQATSIIEAINMNCKLLLIDEDRSATNFMIRDYNMHLIVRDDPIIPFTSRIKEIYNDYDVSIILVICGSSIYLSLTNSVLLLENYNVFDITDSVSNLDLVKVVEEDEKANFIFQRELSSVSLKDSFIYFNTVFADKTKKIILDEYSSDITSLSTIVSDNQINYLTYIMELILSNDKFYHRNIIENILSIHSEIFENKINEIVSDYNLKCNIWFENIRKQDIICTLNRMKNIKFNLLK